MKLKKIKKEVKSKLKGLIKIIFSQDMAFLPGNLAFFLILSIFPLLTLVGIIASEFSLNIDSVINLINSELPKDVASVIVSFIHGKGFDANIGIVMIVGFVLASNGTHAIILASNNLYGFKGDDAITRRIKSIFLIIILLLLFIFMIGFITFGSRIISLLYQYSTNTTLVDIIHSLFVILKWPFSIFVLYFNIKLMYTIAPDEKILSKYTTRGAIFTTIAWIVVLKVYSIWLENFNTYNIFYGSLANIVILIFILYLISFVFVIGIAINVKTYEYNDEKCE